MQTKMEELIEYFDWSSPVRRRRIQEDTLSIWYNTTNKNYAVTISNNYKTNKKFVKIGKIGDNLAFMFNDENGFRVQFCGSPQKTTKQNVKFSSLQLIEYIFTNLDKPKDRKEFAFTKISDDILIFNPKQIK